MNDKDRLDRFLDETLAEYSTTSPRTGLEQRILANLATHRDERRRGWRWLWVAVPGLAAVMLVVALALRPEPKHKEDIASTIPPTMQAAPSLTVTPKPIAPERSVVARIQPKPNIHVAAVAKTQMSPEPRLATFPAPDGDELQARLLLSFVTRHPDKAQEVVREEQEFQQMAEAMMNQDSDNRSERQR